MSLKKSDKIIALVGVLILIVAGIGIVLYSSSDGENDTPIYKNDDKTMFDISFIESASMPIEPDNQAYSIKPKLFNRGIKPYVGNVVISQKNLKSVTFYLKYNDNVKGFLGGRLLGGIGADTLTVNVKDSEENVIFSKSGKGSLMVNETIEFSSMISLEPIEAKDTTDANQQLEKRYINTEETYKITVSLKTGIWGKFREILKKDTFKLEISYICYEYSLVGMNDETPDEPDDDYPPLGSNLGFGVYSATNFGLTKL
ncbi:hypothetical protein AYK24_08880 [Thermoplasmatales archaeon SG8-52-4]|nr:MAG: hypothetical protein AYK24_08880 [Thermoplasmatales archaeon SG8-52-4]